MNEYEANLRPLLGFERLQIEVTMNQIAASLNPKIRKSVMRKLHKDLKILIGEPGSPVVADENSIELIINSLHVGGQIYALSCCQKSSFVVQEAYDAINTCSILI